MRERVESNRLCCTIVRKLVMVKKRERKREQPIGCQPLNSALEMCFLFDGQMASRSSSPCLVINRYFRETEGEGSCYGMA